MNPIQLELTKAESSRIESLRPSDVPEAFQMQFRDGPVIRRSTPESRAVYLDSLKSRVAVFWSLRERKASYQDEVIASEVRRLLDAIDGGK